MLNQILENRSIKDLVKNFSRSPLQKNRFQESDAELINLPGTDMTLAITMDSIVEEIESGLYADPYLIGWMTIMVNASDLAAVGAAPFGILINETFLFDMNDDFNSKLQNGIEDACLECNMHVLGGDTNFSSRMEMTGCAIGYILKHPPMTRLGCKPGDYLFLSGKSGMGNAFALSRLKNELFPEQVLQSYQPKSRLREGQLLSSFATCCMDTSDGVFAALDQLMRLNQVGFRIDAAMENFIHAGALTVCEAARIPLWLMLAGHHGEFELVFTVASHQVNNFLERASQINWAPLLIGEVTEGTDIRFLYHDEMVAINTGKIRNLFAQRQGDVQEYIKQLLEIDLTLTGGSHETI
jgi:thiamine-monophosphate kinase